MGPINNEALAGGGGVAAKPKRGSLTSGPGPGPEPTPGAGPAQGFDGMTGPKGRWMFTPPEQAKVSNENSLVSILSYDPTITSLGGPDSEVMSSDSESGRWILKPFGSLENMDRLVSQPHPSVSGLAGLHHEPSVRKPSRRKRPGAPKPRVLRRSLMRQESLLAAGTAGTARAFRSAPTPQPQEAERERDALAISSAINLAWKEAWDLPAVGPEPAPPALKTKDEVAATSPRLAERKSKDLTFVPEHPAHRSVPEGQPAARKTLQPSAGKEKISAERLNVTQTVPASLSEGKKPKSEQLQTEGRVPCGTEAAVTREYSEEGPIILPRSLAPCMPKRRLLPSDVCPVGICGEPPDHRSDNRYCPWRPHTSFNAWGPGRPNFPGWMSVEEEENISRVIGKEKRLPCSPRKAKYADAATICCLDDFSPKATKGKTTKVIGGKKTIRPEIRRWLAGYPQITRYRRESQDLLRNAPEGMSAEIDETNERHIFVDMLGPDQSLYEGGLFRIEVFFPAEYPRAPPQMRFMTKIYHPNIDKLGRIRLPEIEEKWSPGLLLREALVCVRTLLANPDATEPIAIDVARRWYWQESSAQQTARLWTRKFAHRHSAAAWLDCRCDCCCEQLAAVSVFI